MSNNTPQAHKLALLSGPQNPGRNQVNCFHLVYYKFESSEVLHSLLSFIAKSFKVRYLFPGPIVLYGTFLSILAKCYDSLGQYCTDTVLRIILSAIWNNQNKYLHRYFKQNFSANVI